MIETHGHEPTDEIALIRTTGYDGRVYLVVWPCCYSSLLVTNRPGDPWQIRKAAGAPIEEWVTALLEQT